MKRILLTIVCLAVAIVANGQDRMVLKNAEELSVKVVNISPDTVTYKNWNNLEGPTYTIYKSDVLFIVYQNGTKESFAEIKSVNETNQTKKPLVKFQGYGNLGLIFNPSVLGAGPTVDAGVGILVSDYFYAGFEMGFHNLIYDAQITVNSIKYYLTVDGCYIPMSLNLKGYVTKSKIRPYVNLSLGGFVGVVAFEDETGFYCKAGAGIELKRWTLELGYSGLHQYNMEVNNLYFNVGFRFGGKKYW